MERNLKFIFLHRRELIVMTIGILVFVAVLLFSSRLIILWSNFSVQKEEVQIKASIQQELNDISAQREEIIFSGILNNALKNNDSLQLLTLIQAEVKQRNLDFIVVTDKDGFVLARSGLSVQQGDNIFQTTVQGRRVALGETVNAIVREVKNPLTSISGSYIFEQTKSIGSIFVGYILNSAYADRFQQEHLWQGGQIIFYTPLEGIIGDSLNDTVKTQLINTYFSLGSNLVAQNLTGLSKEINLGGDFYVIRNIVFPGINGSPGGAFILFPISHNSYSLFLASSITLLFFVFYYLTFFLLKFLNRPKHHILFFLLAGSIIFVAVYFITLVKLNGSAIELKKTPYIIYNSVMKFDPESDVINQSSEETVAIKVLTGGEDINAVSAVVSYDPKVVAVLDIVTTKSFCDPSLFIEKTLDKEKGEVRISCMVPNPGFSGSDGIIAELLIQPLDLTPISLTFTNETQVLANDGLGTDVLRTVTNGYYQVVRQAFATADIQNPIPIFSPDHPNSNRWYNNSNIELSWPKLLGGTYYYSLSNNPNLSPKDKITSTPNNYLDTSVGNGIWYFHLQAKDAAGRPGPASSFKIMVDTAPPSPPEIKASSKTVQKGDIVRLDFTSADALSGLQSGFYVQINEGIFLPVKPPFYIPFLDSGDHLIIVRVFNNANNFSDSEITIHVN